MNRLGIIMTISAIAVVCGTGPDNAWAQYPDAAGYTRIHNQRDLSGWKMQWPGIWTVEGGAIGGRQDPATGKDSWLFTEEEWDDFSLNLEFRITKDGNSGIGIRMPKDQEGRPSQHGYEIQIWDADEKFPTGSVFRHVAASRKLQRPPADWNELAIICVGDHIVVYVNRQKVTDARVDGSKKGRIGLQVHGGERHKDQVVQFRNLRIKDLKPQYRAEPSPLAFKAHQLDTLPSEGCAVVDINRDGKLDITCGPNWYEAPDWKAHEYRICEPSGEYLNNFGEVAMDVNGDEWPDIVSGGWFQPVMKWYENPGASGGAGNWKEHLISDQLPRTEGIIGGDIDGDGRTDILVNRYDRNAPVTYFAHVGMDRSESGFEWRTLGHEGRGHGTGFGDVNADGRNDVLTPSGWYECPERPASDVWIWHDYFPEAHESCIPFVVEDFNADGLPDYAWGHAHDFGLYWMEQTKDSAGRQAWIRHTIDDTFSQAHDPVLADVDGDGTKDIVAGKRYRGHNGGDPGANEPLCVFWYRVQKGPDPKFTKHIVTYDENAGSGMSLAALDIDADGDIDVIAPGKTGLHLLENTTR